jgi:putative membrane protein
VWRHGQGWGVFDGWGYWFWPHGPVFWLLVTALVVVAIVWFVRTSIPSDRATDGQRRSRGLDILEERYGRGDISRDEYLQRKRDMTA